MDYLFQTDEEVIEMEDKDKKIEDYMEIGEQEILVSQCFGSILGRIDRARQENRKRFAIVLSVQIIILSMQILIML